MNLALEGTSKEAGGGEWLEAGLRASGGDGEKLVEVRVSSSLSYSSQCLPYDQVSRTNAGLT